MNYLLLVITIVLSAARLAGVTHEAYQAAAHLFVGGLFTSSYTGADESPRQSEYKFGLAAFLCVVEVMCFLWFKFGA